MLNDSIVTNAGIGKKRLYFFNNLGIFFNRDLLFYLPFRYLSLAHDIEEGFCALKVIVIKKIKFSSKFYRIIVDFNGVEVYLNFFHNKFFQIFFKDKVYYICGDVYIKDAKYSINSPNILNSPSKIIPMYKGVSSYLFSSIVLQVIDKLDNSEIIFENYTLKKIFFNLHNGIDYENALNALKYLEASFLCDLFNQKDQSSILLNVNLQDILKNFIYTLSKEQLTVCEKIENTLNMTIGMKYFIYGEVGAGKTIVAIVAMLMVVNAGYTVCLLAPTVALAYQHYQEILRCTNLADEVLLLTGLSNNKAKIKESIALNKYKIIVGTHALMYLKEIPNLGLVVIDEIHKFGVLQRSNLINHAICKNVLMLTATPIPRSLNMILNKLIQYDTLPSFKTKNIKTFWVNIENKMELLSKFQDKKIYWILPNIEESERSEGVEARFTQIQSLMPNVLMLHGKMKDKEKIQIIEDFKNMLNGILISTTVVEIGINIPDADIIIIENAEYFGLSQLHQLRGRVGRMGQESFCILLSKFKSKKMQYMKDYDNGFDISAKDLELRGSGKLTGVLQHGCNSFYFLTESDDAIFLKATQDEKKFKAFNLFSDVNIGY